MLMNIYLLTHQREFERKTNTGVLVAEVLGKNCKLIIWERVNPNVLLLDNIEHQSLALLYPCEDSASVAKTCVKYDGYIIIDATWQEAQKMYNHSPYLKALPKVHFNREKPSIYTLRRNQKNAGLCTAECASEILKVCDKNQAAQDIEQRLSDFITNAS